MPQQLVARGVFFRAPSSSTTEQLPLLILFSIFRRRLEVAILREAGVVLRCAHALELLLGREARAVVGGVDARLIVREQEELCASAARDSMRGWGIQALTF